MLGWRSRPSWSGLAAALLLSASQPTMAYNLDVNSTDSIKTISKSMAEDMLTWYTGNQPGGTPGLLPQPYYWWECGAMFGALIDYWYYTKDDSYNHLVSEGLLFQASPTEDYMPDNQTLTEGNDDQGFWALAVMSAAEYNFPNPPKGEPGWLALAQAVFNVQAARWDDSNCNGGLRWQIFQWNNGYDYKNSISQGCFFALAARLALYTGNKTYADWAEKTWDWMAGVTLLDTDTYYVYDGAHIGDNCTKQEPWQFSYNAGSFLLGAAAMYNYTESDTWKERVDGLLDGAKVFFTGDDKNIMTEVACETVNRCNLDQQSFKAYLSRWMAATTTWVPDTYDFIMPLLRASAVAAGKQCTGGDNGRMCGLRWVTEKFDGITGVGQQMAAMEVTLSCMIRERKAPVTQDNGGTSKGDPSAGGSDIGKTQPSSTAEEFVITAGAKAGAAIITAVIAGGLIAVVAFMIWDDKSDGQGEAAAALAASGGLAAAVTFRRNRRDPEMQEKGKAVVNETSDSSSRHSSVQQPAPVAFRDSGDPRRSRRASNMPIGWPHNPSLRGSVLVDPNRNSTIPADASRAELEDPDRISAIPADSSSTPLTAPIPPSESDVRSSSIREHEES